ncbi:MAG: sugar kinase [Kiritimatiellae bacterium]|jgi:2-dehydro-3-deoxygluconokinase|nr:sugar kinase [Kiritimatiellia bacterium]MDD2347960.1 sugar kinase [Kiritimatiellia bacterium]MDD3583737.1 sugar kinase [Kiritimatiellia bacterium]HHU16555.1 sugar kinase [Lentisphaerota bacterium]HON48672.1 sugar kinase [Kiritimatiellia bacterium]
MSTLTIKPAGSCRFDEISLGEIMLRLDPGDSRIKNARSFTVWEGGGEYNVARGLRKCFGLQTAVVTALPENDIGHLVEDFVMQGGVDTSLIKWVPFDGIGAATRVGLNFTERGFGLRGALGVSDRGHSAASQLKPGDIDWEYVFGTLGARWFHTGGIYAALSETTPLVLEEAMAAARKHGTIISYDLNYRPSLWKAFGGQEACRKVNRRLAKYVDVMIGNEEDYTACLGLAVEGVDANLSALPIDGFKRMIERALKEFPNFKVAATTLRTVKSASVNDWSAICWYDGSFHQAMEMKDLWIYDRVGGGDSFASGLIYGLLTFNDAQKAVNYGCAHGALAMTTPGDTSMASKAEVEKVVAGGSARVVR